MPGRVITGKVDYYACFHDLPDGIQTHCYAPMGLDIRSRWRIAGSLPGEPRESAELGLGIPHEGLYIREDVVMKCNIMLTSFVKKTFKKAHGRLVDRLREKTHVVDTDKHNESIRQSARHSASMYGASSTGGTSTPSTPSYGMPGSPPLASVSPRFSGTTAITRPDSPASHHTGGPSPYFGSPMLAAQMAAQGLDPNNPQHQAYISPLFYQMDPAYRNANPYEQGGPGSMTNLGYDSSNPHGDMKMGYPHPMGYPPPRGPPPMQAVEIASSELKHPAMREDGKLAPPPPVPAKVPHAPAEMEG